MGMIRTALMVVAMVIARTVDYTNPFNVFAVRCALWGHDGGTLVAHTLTSRRNRGRGPPAASSVERTEQKTATEHDVMQAKKLLTRVIISSLVSGLLHFKWGFNPPIFMQCFYAPQVLMHPLCYIYIFGYEATGELARPFKEDNPLDFGLGASTPEQSPRDERRRKARVARKTEAKKRTGPATSKLAE